MAFTSDDQRHVDCMRKALELKTTAHPAAANSGSISFMIEEIQSGKNNFGAPEGVAGDTVISPPGQNSSPNRQRVLGVRSSFGAIWAASHETSNHG